MQKFKNYAGDLNASLCSILKKGDFIQYVLAIFICIYTVICLIYSTIRKTIYLLRKTIIYIYITGLQEKRIN